ncbi:MAG: TolC family protein [Aureliella sp.]
MAAPDAAAAIEPNHSKVVLASAVVQKVDADLGPMDADSGLLAAESVAAEAATEDQIPGQAMGLTDAVATALFRNPDLVAARGQEQVSIAALGVAETYPWNPFVQSQLLPGTGGSNPTQTNYYVWFMQRMELAHQQQYREQAASAALNQVRWNIHQTELLNIAQTARLYFTAQYQFELYQLADETALLNEKLLGVVQRRYNAGLATSAAVTTAQVAARQSRRQASLANATYQAALLAVAQQLNPSETVKLSLRDRLGDYRWQAVRTLETSGSENETALANPEALAAELVKGRPDVMAARYGIAMAGANARLADAARMPDLQAGPILNAYPSGAETLGVRFQMDLPVWNTGQPLANQRHVERNQQVLIFNQLRVRATLEAQTAINRYERARLLVEESRVDLSPFEKNPPADLRKILEQFEAGQADVLAVFATQNSLLQDRRTYLDLLNEVSQAAAGVVQATGVPLERLVTRDAQ